jgi:UDP-galactopyranose mutase
MLPSPTEQKPFDFLVVGAGLYGACFARIAADHGRRVLVLERRPHVGGNCYSEEQEGIQIHRYGPHIFHTSNEAVWRFVNRYTSFNNFINSPLAMSQGDLFSLPFNMHTFHQLWGVITPQQAEAKLAQQRLKLDRPAANLEEQALSLVGEDLYNRLIKGYTKKQWLCEPSDLPADIIKRLPVRLTYNTNYFNDRYQGIPRGGYTAMFCSLLKGIDVRLGVNFHADRTNWTNQASVTVYTGQIDELFDYDLGDLNYRTLRFEDQWHETANFQGNAVINYCDETIPYTRMIEHKHFEPDNPCDPARTVVTQEIPEPWGRGKIPYYPVHTADSHQLYKRYAERAAANPNLILGGRLAEFRYMDMHAVIASALLKCRSLGMEP